MPSRRRLKKEEKEELEKKKKALKKSFQKSHADSKRVGSSRISDTKKYGLIIGVAVAIVLIITFTFLGPPEPIYYYTEIDFVHATLDQDTQSITFDRIRAWYKVNPKYTTLSCTITDYFNDSYQIIEPSLPIPPFVSSDEIYYEFNELDSAFSWETIMENGTSLEMSTWVELVKMNTIPSTIIRGNETTVKFYLELKNTFALDSYNISLRFYENPENTTVEHISTVHGSFDSGTFTFSTRGNALAADSSIILEFNLNITSANPLSELNFLASGEVNLVKNDQLLKDYSGASAFKESFVDFTPYLMDEEEPRPIKSTALNVQVSIPYYNVTLVP